MYIYIKIIYFENLTSLKVWRKCLNIRCLQDDAQTITNKPLGSKLIGLSLTQCLKLLKSKGICSPQS